MKTRTVLMIGAGVLALGLAGAQIASADGGHGWRGQDHWQGHGYGHMDHSGYWGRDGHGPEGRGDGWHRFGAGQGGGGPRFALLFDLLDVNADGTVSREEALRAPGQRFARMDTDGNGFISAEEGEAAAEIGAGGEGPRAIERLDADGDGQVSKAEFEVRARAMFARADANDDGLVTLDEFTKAGGTMGARARRFGFIHGPMMESEDAGDAGDESGTEK